MNFHLVTISNYFFKSISKAKNRVFTKHVGWSHLSHATYLDSSVSMGSLYLYQSDVLNGQENYSDGEKINYVLLLIHKFRLLKLMPDSLWSFFTVLIS
jgi:hypothetical protein